VDDLLCQLELRSLGCCINNVYVGCVMYADDILLMSTSVRTLQSVLNLCYEYGVIHNIIFNSLKSCCLQVGHKRSVVSHMYLNDVPINWVNSFKYLGIMFTAESHLRVDCSFVRRKFYASCNAIFY